MRPLPLIVSIGVLAVGCTRDRDRWLAELQSPRPEQRAAALRHLAEGFREEDLRRFTQAARDPSPLVRAEAIAGIAKSQDAAVLDLLGEALADPDTLVQRSAASGLASRRSEKSQAYMTLQYVRQGQATRLLIVKALKEANVPGAMARAVATEAQLLWDRNLRALQEGSAAERVGAAEALGASGRPEAVNRLVALLEGPQVLALAAARGLGAARDQRAVPSLVALLDAEVAELREAASQALGQLGATSVAARLALAALEGTASSPAAAAALVALPRGTETDAVLCRVLIEGRPDASVIAGRELRRRGGCPLEGLRERLRGPPTVLAALQAVAALGPPAASLAEGVLPHLSAGDAALRQAAADALGELGAPAAVGPVAAALQAELAALAPLRGPWVKARLPERFGEGFGPGKAPLSSLDGEAAAKGRVAELLQRVDALAERQAAEQGKVLRPQAPPAQVVDDVEEAQTRSLAVLLRAVGRLRIDATHDAVRALAVDPMPSVRAAAVGALARLGGADQKLARAALLDPDVDVRTAAAGGLADGGDSGILLLLEALVSLPGDRRPMLELLKGRTLPAPAAPHLTRLVDERGPEAGLASVLLAELRHRAVLPALLAGLGDAANPSRREFLVAVARLGDASAAEAVGPFLYSESAEVRALAAEVLATLGPGPHREALDALRGDYAVRVREAAAAALRLDGAGAPPVGDLGASSDAGRSP